jgi:hypothetical protein
LGNGAQHAVVGLGHHLGFIKKQQDKRLFAPTPVPGSRWICHPR